MSIITLIAACKWSIMTTIVLLVVALFIGLDQPYVDEKTGKISKRFPDHWIRFQAIMSGVLFGGMVKALKMDAIDWERVIAETVPRKFRELNLSADRAGYAAT